MSIDLGGTGTPADDVLTSYSVYTTAEEADEYFSETRLDTTTWDALTATEKEITLVIATRAIDRLAYKGSKADEDQEQEFPRGTDEEVPQQIKDACAELAFAYAEGRDVKTESENVHVTSRKFGPVSITMKPDGLYREHLAAGIISLEAWYMLLPFLRNIDQIQVNRV